MNEHRGDGEGWSTANAAAVTLATAALAGAVCALTWASDAAAGLVGVSTRASVDQIVGGLSVAAGWLCLAWLSVSIGAALLATVPGHLGAVADVLAGAITPHLLRRAVALTLAFGATTLAFAPLAQAQPSGPRPGGSDHPIARLADLPLGAYPPLDWPAVSNPLGLDPLGPDPLAPGPDREVVVAPGDTLWGIAARHLPPGSSAAAVDTEWRRWYAVNRAVVGPDPDLIFPGQRLETPPTSAQGATP